MSFSTQRSRYEDNVIFKAKGVFPPFRKGNKGCKKGRKLNDDINVGNKDNIIKEIRYEGGAAYNLKYSLFKA